MSTWRIPWLALTVASICVLLQTGGETWAEALAFHRGRIGSWGLDALSGQWVHWGWAHALGNAAVLLLCGAYLEQRVDRLRLLAATLLIWGTGALCLLEWARDLAEYRGASGLSAGWLALAAIRFSGVRGVVFKMVLGIVVGLLLCVPAWLDHASSLLPAGVRSVWEIHLMAGVIAGALADWCRRTRLAATAASLSSPGAGERAR